MDYESYITEKNISIMDALKKLDENGGGIIFIVDSQERLCGCVTDGDIRRWILETNDLSAKITKFMHKDPKYLFTTDLVNPVVFMKEKHIKALPIIDEDKVIRKIVFQNEDEKVLKSKSRKLDKIQVVIMAGGMGTRLHPYTKILPKPLIPIGGIPIIERIINAFADFGAEDFYVTVNFKKGMIRSYFEDLSPAYRLSFVEEGKPLGTAGSLKLIGKHLTGPCFVTNCDILIHADFGDIYEYHMNSGNDITVVSSMKSTVIPYGVIECRKGGGVSGLQEKPVISNFINTGMYIINPALLERIPENTFYHMTDMIADALKNGLKIGMYPVSEDSFLDMGEFEELKRMEEKLGKQSM